MKKYEKMWEKIKKEIKESGFHFYNDGLEAYYVEEAVREAENEEFDRDEFYEYLENEIDSAFKKYSTDWSYVKNIDREFRYYEPDTIYLTDENFKKFKNYYEAYCKLGSEIGFLNEFEEEKLREIFPEYFK